MYRAIQRGITGTSMPSNDLPDPQIWQIIAFLQNLKALNRQNQKPGQDRSVRAVTHEEREGLAADEWLTYSGNYGGWRHSVLHQLDKTNVDKIRLAWVYQSATNYRKYETNPLVVDGVMFLTEPEGSVIALDSATGKELWKYQRGVPQDLVLCCGVVNRGTAIAEGMIISATIDAHLIALDSATGKLVWEVEVADHRYGYSITAAPLAINNIVITGVAGGESGIRGYLDAYDVKTGKLVWRFHTTPNEGQPESETWPEGNQRLGGATWVTGSYDPSLDLIYWGTGHSIHNPEVSEEQRGDELYGSSILAIEASTGALEWHYQTTPDDAWGFDSNQVPVLVDAEFQGERRKLLLNANRNGFYYVLDRETGEFLSGTEFAKQTWVRSLSPNGRPDIDPAVRPTPGGVLNWPGSNGATNWSPPAYSPNSGLIYIPVTERPSIFFSQSDSLERGEHYVRILGRPAQNVPRRDLLRSLEATSGELVWEREFPPSSSVLRMRSLLSTGGGLLFVGDDTVFYALDETNGEILWQFETGGAILGTPISYAVNGRQFVSIAAGRSILTFSLD